MKLIFTLSIVLFFIPFAVLSQDLIDDAKSSDALIGQWTIDLRPTPDAEAYYQPFVVEMIDKNTFSGTFYGSSIENSLLNDSWDKLYFAFTTKDQNNAYYHSGYLLNGKLFGITYCPGRNFTAPWTGIKK